MRKRKDFTRLEGIRSARLVVIAAEGRETENIYFEAMKRELSAENVHVEVLHRNDNNSNPDNVLSQLQNFKDEYNIDEDDELWVVVDRDRWREKTLSTVAKYCHNDSNLKFCVSNPCFELWLLLHLEDVNVYSTKDLQSLTDNKKVKRNGPTWLKNRMKSLMGTYHESNYDVGKLLPYVDKAIERAKSLDSNPKDRWPQRVGTRVYLLAKSIMG